jgi:hypothetical protein
MNKNKNYSYLNEAFTNSHVKEKLDELTNSNFLLTNKQVRTGQTWRQVFVHNNIIEKTNLKESTGSYVIDGTIEQNFKTILTKLHQTKTLDNLFSNFMQYLKAMVNKEDFDDKFLYLNYKFNLSNIANFDVFSESMELTDDLVNELYNGLPTPDQKRVGNYLLQQIFGQNGLLDISTIFSEMDTDKRNELEQNLKKNYFETGLLSSYSNTNSYSYVNDKQNSVFVINLNNLGHHNKIGLESEENFPENELITAIKNSQWHDKLRIKIDKLVEGFSMLGSPNTISNSRSGIGSMLGYHNSVPKYVTKTISVPKYVTNTISNSKSSLSAKIISDPLFKLLGDNAENPLIESEEVNPVYGNKNLDGRVNLSKTGYLYLRTLMRQEYLNAGRAVMDIIEINTKYLVFTNLNNNGLFFGKFKLKKSTETLSEHTKTYFNAMYDHVKENSKVTRSFASNPIKTEVKILNYKLTHRNASNPFTDDAIYFKDLSLDNMNLHIDKDCIVVFENCQIDNLDIVLMSSKYSFFN